MPHLTSRAAVGQDAAGAHVLAAAEDLYALHLVGQVLDVGAERVTRALDAASCRLFCWRQSLCRAKGGAAAAYCCMRVEKERSGSGVGAAAERCERGA